MLAFRSPRIIAALLMTLLASLAVALILFASMASGARAASNEIGWDEHSASYVQNGQAVHIPHSHPAAPRETMPTPAEGERLIVVERVAGADRYETAVLLNQMLEIGISPAFVVNGANPVDALPAAATNLGPVFYVPPTGSAPTSVVQELYHLQPDVIIVIGGPSVISDSVLQSLAVIQF